MTVLFGRYEEDRVLSRRATTATLLCRDSADLPVVLKVFRSPSDTAREKLRERASALQQLDHPGLARCLGFEEDRDDVAIAFAWVEGETVAAMIERGRRFTTDELWDCLAQVTLAMTAAHRAPRPVVHRDVKPQNLVLAGARYVLIDFDAARELFDTHSNASVVGTTGYAAPEQFVGRAVPASDQYGLAATVLHMATHRHPGEFELKRLRIDLSATDISAPLKRTLTRMLEPQPAARFPDGDVLLTAIDSGSGVEPWETALVPLEKLSGSIVQTTRTPDELRIDIAPRWRPASVVFAGGGAVLVAAASLIAVLVYDVRFTLAILGVLALAAGVPHARMEWRRRGYSSVRITNDEWSIESADKRISGPRDRPPQLSATRMPSLESSMFLESRAGLTATSEGESIDFGLGMLPAEAEAVRSAMESALAREHDSTALNAIDSTALVKASVRFDELDSTVRNPFRIAYAAVSTGRPLKEMPALPDDFLTRLELEGFRPLGGYKSGILGFVAASKFACFVSTDGTMLIEAKLGGIGEAEPGMTYHIISCVDAPRARYTWSHSRVTTSSTDRVSSAPTSGKLQTDLTAHREWLEAEARHGNLPVRFEAMEDRMAFHRFYDRQLASAKTLAIVLTMVAFLLAPVVYMLYLILFLP